MNRGFYQALTVSALTALLAACSQSGADRPVIPSATGQAGAHGISGSYGDLVYVSTAKAIQVLTYPDMKIVQSLPAPYAYSAICSDPNNGNIYIAAGTEVVVYAHGGTQPTAILNPPTGASSLNACAVDPTTGNLVVTSLEGGLGNAALLLYQGGQGDPTVIATKQLDWYWYPTFDDKGNLFTTCWTKHGQFHFDELPAGKTKFISIKVVVGFSVNKIQWDGTYLAFEEFYGHGTSKVFQLQVSGRVGAIVSQETYAGVGESSNFWIYKGKLFNALGKIKAKNNQGVGAWSYPAGGEPVERAYGVTRGASDKIIDLTVSVAPSR